MEFYDVVDQVTVLLQQRGRVSYRALKRQFQLDEAVLSIETCGTGEHIAISAHHSDSSQEAHNLTISYGR